MVRADIKRTSLNQNLRGALDILGINIRIAGERLPGFFPAILVTDNGTGDTFTMRRSMLDENLVACFAIASGTTDPIVFGDSASTEANCAYSNKTDVLNAWAASRVEQGGIGLAYIYDRITDVGEWFEWTSEIDTGTLMSIAPSSGSWTNNYTNSQAFAYVLEEWQFSLNGDTLQMVIDNDTANPINVVDGLTAFNVELELYDGTVVTSYAEGDDWSDVALIRITLAGEEQSGDRTITRSMNGSFLPRNVMSN